MRLRISEHRGVVAAIAGVLVLGLVGLGVRAVPALLSDPPEAVAATPLPAAPEPAVPAETSPTPAAATSSAASQRATTGTSPNRKKSAEKSTGALRPVKASSVPATGSGRYDHADLDVAAPTSTGRLIRYDVRVETTLKIDPDEAAAFIAATLNDKRSWRGSGRWRFEQVSSADRATLHAYLVTPGTTDQLCAPLLTRGEVSCENGNRVVLNAKRWLAGADAYGNDLIDYRRYLVNHEFGHALGHGHVGCPGRGKPDPVMMQQTKGLNGCTKNPWPVGTDY